MIYFWTLKNNKIDLLLSLWQKVNLNKPSQLYFQPLFPQLWMTPLPQRIHSGTPTPHLKPPSCTGPDLAAPIRPWAPLTPPTSQSKGPPRPAPPIPTTTGPGPALRTREGPWGPRCRQIRDGPRSWATGLRPTIAPRIASTQRLLFES